MSYNEAGGVFEDNQPEKVDISFSKVDDTFLDKFEKFLERAESRHERYELTWNGKSKAFAEAGRPLDPAKTLRPDLDESVDFDNTQNLFITGDNLEVLKLLQESYLNKIDMIYIDPPYNTGHDFIYHDNFHKAQSDEIGDSRDDDGNRQFTVNSRENGRYHSDWLSMLYPRLILARNLLSEKGVIFISIDDNEQADLRILCDDVFGQSNFISCIVWNSSKQIMKQSKTIRKDHEYVLCYAKSNSCVQFKRLKNTMTFSNPDNDPNGNWFSSNATAGGKYEFGITLPSGNTIVRKWNFTEDEYKSGVVKLYLKGDNVPRRKIYESEYDLYTAAQSSIIASDIGTTTTGINDVKRLFDGCALFDNPKPIDLIRRFVYLATSDSSIILDFFAGSGTTAHAAMKLNAEDGGHRKFIMVQLDEKCDEKSEAYKAGYKTIDRLSRERIRRATKQIKETDKNAADHDYGFRALYVDKSNVNDDVFATADVDRTQLQFQVNNIRNDRSPLDLLFGVLVAKGWQLDGKVQERQIGNNAVYLYDYLLGAGMVSCFDENLDSETVDQIINMHPNVAVFRESSFNKSSDKLNLMERFKNDSPETSVWVI